MTAERGVEEIGALQLRLIERSQEFLETQFRSGVDVAVSPECYLNSWANVVGNARVRVLANLPGANRSLAIWRLREAMLVAGQSGYETIVGENPATNLRHLIVSWCRNSDFAEDGSYFDRYFRISSRDSKGVLWFVVALDEAVPSRLQSNVVLFRRRPGVARKDYLFWMGVALRALRRPRASSHGIRPRLSGAVCLADQVANAAAVQLKAGRFESIALPYEAQPFQHAIFRVAKQAGLRTVGYLHSALPPLPTDLIWRDGAPDVLLTHGRGQQDILINRLGWPASALRCVPSLRYRREDRSGLASWVFLPYHFENQTLIVNAFGAFLNASSPGSLPALAVRNHPVMRESRRHLELAAALEKTMARHRDRFSIDPCCPPVSVFIGATAAILEALEHGIDAVHICAQPLFESHSSEVWRSLTVHRLGEHAFKYHLRVPGDYIEFGAQDDSIERHLDDIAH